MEELTINEFVKQMRELFPMCEYKATKDNQVFKSKGWKDIPEGVAHIPFVDKKEEVKRGRK